MSKIKSTILLATGCILAGTALWWLGKPELMPYARSEKRSTILNAHLDGISEIRLFGHSGVERKFVFANGNWRMMEPGNHPAAPSAISRLLDVIERAPLVDCISAKECTLRELSDSSFGLDHPAGGVTISGPNSFRNGATITIGDFTSVSNEVFVTVGNHQFPYDVCVTTRELADIVNEPDVNFIDERLFRNNARRVNTIILSRGTAGTIKLVRDRSDRWLITQPVQARADWDFINDIFAILYSAKITDLQPRVSAKEAGCGDENAIRLQLFGQDIPAGLSVTFGNQATNCPDIVYAQISGDPSPVVVTGAVSRLASISLKELRDKHVFAPKCGINMNRLSFERAGRTLSFKKNDDGVWTVTDPVAANASPDIVSRLISSVLSLKATDVVGIAPTGDAASKDLPKSDPTAPNHLTISFTEPGASYNLKLFEAGNADSPVVTQKLYKAMLNKENTVYELCDNPSIEFILESIDMPHTTVDKKILDIDEKAVSRIEIAKGDGSSEVIENANGEWSARDTSAGTVSKAVVARFFKTLRPLNAESVISVSKDVFSDLDQPAIAQEMADAASREKANNDKAQDSQSAVARAMPDSTRFSIIFNFSDGPSLQHTLLLGPALPEPQNGFYARVKGRNAVYAISLETMSILTQSFLSPVSPEGELPSAAPLAPTPSGSSSNE